MPWSLVILGLPSLFLLAGIFALWKRRRESRLAWRFGAALGWCSAAVLPAAMVQVALHLASGPGFEILGVTLVAWWVLLGGATAVATFEDTVRLVSDHRQMTMVDNWPYFLTLVFLQTLFLSAFLAPCFGSEFRWKRPRLWWVFALLVTNSCLAIRWPWWGS